MSRQRFVHFLCPALVALLVLAGCGDDGKTDGKKSPSKQQAKHPGHGPNDGHLFELEAEGGEHYHVEFFEDEKAKKLVAVLLGADSKTEFQSSAAEATLETTAGSDKKSFKLKAEAKDKASRYSTDDASALEAVKAKDAKFKFQIEIDGKTYTAQGEDMVH